MSASAKTATVATIGKRKLTLTNVDKILYPADAFTKGQVIAYYLRMADTILPHLRGRPLTLKRYPNGVDKMFFYEKMCPSHRPEWVHTKKIPAQREEGYVNYCVANEAATLVWVANLASLELHVLLSREENIQQPTSMVFDLDPGPPADMLDCMRVAFRMRDLFKSLKLECFPKTSGGKGLHLYVPLNTKVTFDQTKAFAHGIAETFERDDPKRVISKMSREARQGKVFVDWSQNDEHKTTVCVYSLRAREHPTVSTPVTWEELERAAKKKDPSKLVFRAEDVLKRIEKLGDLFEPVVKLKQRLPKS